MRVWQGDAAGGSGTCSLLCGRPPMHRSSHQPAFVAGLRAISVLWAVQFTTAVLQGHFVLVGHRTVVLHEFETGFATLTNGFLAVEILLVLSGFLFGARVFQQLKTSSESPGVAWALRLTLGRLARLVPMIVFTCAAVAIATPMAVPISACRWSSLVASPFFLGNTVTEWHRQCVPWIWPLQPIAFASLVLPVLVLVCARLPALRRLGLRRGLQVACTLAFVACEVPNYFFSSASIPLLDLFRLGPVLSWPHTQSAGVLRAGSCFLGALASVDVYCPTAPGRQDDFLGRKWQPGPRNAALLGCLVVGLGVGIGHWLPLYAGTTYRNAFLVSHRLVFKACVAGCLWLMHRAPPLARKLVLWTCQRRPVTFIATVAYPTLMLHPLAVYMVVSANGAVTHFWGLTAGATALALVLGTGAFLLLDLPWLRSAALAKLRGPAWQVLVLEDATGRSVPGSSSYLQVGQELPRIDEESEFSDSDVSEPEPDSSALLEAGFGGGGVIGGGVGALEVRPATGLAAAPHVVRAPVPTADAGSFRVFRRLGRGAGPGAGVGDLSGDAQRLLGAGGGVASDADWYGDDGETGDGGSGASDGVPSGEGEESGDDASGGASTGESGADSGSDEDSGSGSGDGEGSEDDIVLTEEDYEALRDAGTTVADLATEVMASVSQLPSATIADVASAAVNATEAIGGSDALARRVLAVVVDVTTAE